MTEALSRNLQSSPNQEVCVPNLESRLHKNRNPSNVDKNLMEKMFESHCIMFKHHFLIVCSASQKCELKINFSDNIDRMLFLAVRTKTKAMTHLQK